MKTHSNSLCNIEKTAMLPLLPKVSAQQCQLSPLLVNIVPDVLASIIRQ